MQGIMSNFALTELNFDLENYFMQSMTRPQDGYSASILYSLVHIVLPRYDVLGIFRDLQILHLLDCFSNRMFVPPEAILERLSI